MQWHFRSKHIPESYEELRELLFENRGISQADQKEFLEPIHPEKISLESVGIDAQSYNTAQQLLKEAIAADKQIVVFGDYDADGICATAILWQALYDMYTTIHPDGTHIPMPFIPHREKHGYGISQIALEEIQEKHKPDVVITVDNGIVAHEAVEFANSQGITTIITDHHQPETDKKGSVKLPAAECVVHTTQLCGATLAWMIVRELHPKLAAQSLDLAGIATIADQVPLQHANRSFAQYGVLALQKTQRLGLHKLFEVAQIKQEEITEWSIGFGIAPRINAVGRLDSGMPALRLLCTNNPKQASQLAGSIHEINTQRQDLTKDLLELAEKQVVTIESENILIVHSDQFHEGVLGLIAGELTQKYYKPAIAISTAGEVAKGSARSVSGVSIIEILRSFQDKLLAVGGHPMAAGFSFSLDRIAEISKDLFEFARTNITAESLEKTLKVDCQLPLELVVVETAEHLREFAPFGMKNPQPQFAIQDLEVLSMKTIGKGHKHIKLQLGNPRNLEQAQQGFLKTFDALGWNMAETILEQDIQTGDTVSIVGGLSINEWKGRVSVQMMLKDVRK